MAAICAFTGPPVAIAAPNEEVLSLFIKNFKPAADAKPELVIGTFQTISELLKRARPTISPDVINEFGIINVDWYQKTTQQAPGCIVLAFDWRTYPTPTRSDDVSDDPATEELRLGLQQDALDWMTRIRDDVARLRIPKRFRRTHTSGNAPPLSRFYYQPTPKILPLIIFNESTEKPNSSEAESIAVKKAIYRYLDCFNALMTRHRNDFTTFFVLAGIANNETSKRLSLLERTARRSASDFLTNKEKRYQKLLSLLPTASSLLGINFNTLLQTQSLPWLEQLIRLLRKLSPSLESAPDDFVTFLASQMLRIKWMLKLAFCYELEGKQQDALNTYLTVFDLVEQDYPPQLPLTWTDAENTGRLLSRQPLWKRPNPPGLSTHGVWGCGSLGGHAERAAVAGHTNSLAVLSVV